MTITFTQMGFAPEVTAASATPATDGYFGSLNGLPYGIHPTATPDAYAALVAAIPDGAVTVTAYAAPVVALADARATQTAMLYEACQSAILGGFTSSALGSEYTYPSTDIDQRNLASAVGAAIYHSSDTSWTTQLWCEASGASWAFADHTSAQVLQVNSAFVPFRTALQSLLSSGMQAVDAATTVSGVEAITWASLAPNPPPRA